MPSSEAVDGPSWRMGRPLSWQKGRPVRHHQPAVPVADATMLSSATPRVATLRWGKAPSVLLDGRGQGMAGKTSAFGWSVIGLYQIRIRI